MYGIVKEENKLLKFLHIDSFILFLTGFLFLLRMGNNLNESNTYFQVAFLLGAVILCGLTLTKIRNKWDFKHQGIAAIGFFASTFIIYAIAINYLFFIDKEHSGFINPRAFANNTPCSNNTFIYISQKGNNWYYRCPKESASGLFIVMGNQFNFPLLPWPSYYEGKSKAIEQALHTKEGNQIHIN